MFAEERYAYIAGLIDAEGYLGIRKRAVKKNRENYRPALVLAMRDRIGLDLMISEFGGEIKIYPSNNTLYYLTYNAIKVNEILEKCGKYLIIHQEEMSIIHELQESKFTQSQNSFKPDLHLYRAELFQKIKKENLNKTFDLSNLNKEWSNINNDSISLAYCAGFIDGEGSFGIYNRKNNNKIYTHATFAIAATDYRAIEKIAQTLGGHVLTYEQKENWKAKYLYLIQSQEKLAAFIPVILPYLQVKKEQAALCYEYLLKEPRPDEAQIFIKKCQDLKIKGWVGDIIPMNNLTMDPIEITNINSKVYPRKKAEYTTEFLEKIQKNKDEKIRRQNFKFLKYLNGSIKGILISMMRNRDSILKDKSLPFYKEISLETVKNYIEKEFPAGIGWKQYNEWELFLKNEFSEKCSLDNIGIRIKI